jgi:hypothetical protein
MTASPRRIYVIALQFAPVTQGNAAASLLRIQQSNGRPNMRAMRSMGSAVVLGAMIPLTLLNSLPGTGCFCADGRFKLFCERCLHTDAPSGNDALAGKRCPCCFGRAGSGSVARCPHCVPQGRASCCKQVARHGSEDSSRCCTPVFRSPLAASSEVALPQNGEFVLASLSTDIVIESGWPKAGGHRIERADILPPVDLVIVHHVLLI